MLFQRSSYLAAAYGVAVTAEMVITSLIAFFVIWRMWGWKLWQVALLPCRCCSSSRRSSPPTC